MGERFEYISRQLAQLEIVKNLPDADVSSDHLVNRAMDVLSASLMYMAIQIRHEAGYFGVAGKLPHPPHSRLTGSREHRLNDCEGER
jgi:hypothetical protein